jgi:2-dehydro-3-deoxy-D-gluconate 5-dehydrogenase
MAVKTIAQLFDLSGKGAIVTGGGMGIGTGICRRLAEAGAGVMIADIDLDAANKVVENITSRGGKAKAIRADVSNADDAEKAVQATIDAFGSMDILVNNAGIFPSSTFLDMRLELWDKVQTVNVKGTLIFSKAAAKAMIKAGHGGKIINMASVGSVRPMKAHTAYDTSKAGVLLLTKSMALELAPHNILVNAVAPGGIHSQGGAAARSERSKLLGMSEEEMGAALRQRMPLGRVGSPDDIAKVVLFLVSEAADFITGDMILVDGGNLLT